MIKITPYGAAKMVTGSLYLFELDNGKKFLVECGMFQGENEELNYKPFPFDPKEIEYVIITHAHLDHIGLLPKLIEEGFEGEIISTPATRDIAHIMLMDAAHVQEEEWKSQIKRAKRRGEYVPEPLYTMEDVFYTMSRFKISVSYEGEIELWDGKVKVKFKDAGHILGSSFLEIKIDNKNIVFSGDLGNPGKPIIKDPQNTSFENVDLLIIESTYGKRKHKSIEESIEELKEAILETFSKGGNVLIPSFALERAQDILFYLFQFYKEGILPKQTIIFLDSPLAINATKIFKAHTECFDTETAEMLRKGEDPFHFEKVKYTRTVEESKKINDVNSYGIIIAGSGMCQGGRIKHHLKHNLWRPESSVVFVGYQAKGTLGRKIIDGAKEVFIYGEKVQVNSKIYTINGFSAHADKDELIRWASEIKGKNMALVVHGEEEESKSLNDALNSIGFQSQIAEIGKTIIV